MRTNGQDNVVLWGRIRELYQVHIVWSENSRVNESQLGGRERMKMEGFKRKKNGGEKLYKHGRREGTRKMEEEDKEGNN
jgi:hypothetical protein